MSHIAIRVFSVLMILFSSQAISETTPLQETDGMIAKNDLDAAMAKVDQGLAKNADDPEWLIRKSRIVSIRGDAKSEESEKEALFEEAQKIATKAIDKDPKNAGGYLRRAVAAGKLALYKGILQSRVLVLKIKADATKTLELKSSSNYQKALANYLLGRSHLKVAEKPKALRIPIGLGWASKKKGREHIKKAAELAPESIPFTLQEAKMLIADGKKDAAKTMLEKIKDLKVIDPADPKHQAEAVKLLAEL